MKITLSALTALLLVLQYGLWFDQTGVFATMHLNHILQRQLMTNHEFSNRNQLLSHEVNDLKAGLDSVEEHARNDLGMVKKEEKFYQYVD